VSIYPSGYVNIGGELQLGSLAGLNLRAYAGFADGFSQWTGNVTKLHFRIWGLA